MTVSSDFGAVDGGTDSALGALPPGSRTGGAPNVDPRMVEATSRTNEEAEKRRRKVKDRGEDTKRFNRGLSDIDEKGKRDVSGIKGGDSSANRGTMPPMPQMAQGGAPAPAPSPSPSPAMQAPMTPPAGLVSVDPGLLQQLVELSNAQAAELGPPGAVGSPADFDSATTPQKPQPLDKSQVTYEKHPGGKLSFEETAAVIDQALTINGVPNDPELRARWHELYQHMSAFESNGGQPGGDPNAGNDWDVNATGPRNPADGLPSNSSRGQWQCVPGTFAAYHMGGTSTSIYDPVASAAASMNYVMDVYNITPDGDGLAAFAARQGVKSGTYQGY